MVFEKKIENFFSIFFSKKLDFSARRARGARGARARGANYTARYMK